MNSVFTSHYSIFGSFVTNVDFAVNPEIPIEYIEEIVTRIAAPLNRKLKFVIRGNDLRLKPGVYPFNESYWDKIKKYFIDGKVKHLIIYADVFDVDTAGLGPKVAITTNIKDYSERGEGLKVSSIEFSVHRLFFENGIVPKSVETEFVNIIHELTNKAKIMAGYITFDDIVAEMGFSGAVRSPYETYCWYTINSIVKDINKIYRGYYWGNFLSKEHVEILGGLDKIKKEAPVALVRPLFDGGVYLQLTEDINDFSDECLKRLKDYLAPLLHKTVNNDCEFMDSKVYSEGMRLIREEGDFLDDGDWK